MLIKKALITAAGFGTRFLPISKTIQKEMLPILNRPIVDYVVSDCVNAGIEEIIFVVSEHNRQLRHYYSENSRLYEYLNKMKKLGMYSEIEHIHSQAKFTFIEQSADAQYGTAIPVQLAHEQLKDEEAFLVFMGDDFIFNTDGRSEASQMIELFTKSGAEALATCITKPDADLSRYGIAKTRYDRGYTFLETLVEKPAPGTAPSNLANISKYIFTPLVFEVMAHQLPDAKSGELYITDSITSIAQDTDVVIHTPAGRYLDGGNVLDWLKSNLVVAKNDPELAEDLASFIKEEFSR